MMNYNYKPNYLNGKALSQHSISSLTNKNLSPACVHLHTENNFKTNRSIGYNLNNSNLSLNQQKILLGGNSTYYQNPIVSNQVLNSKSVVNRTNSFRNGQNPDYINPNSIDSFLFSCNTLTNKFTDMSLQKLNKKILSIDKYIKNNRSESSSTISLLSDLEFEIKEDLTVHERDHKPDNTSASKSGQTNASSLSKPVNGSKDNIAKILPLSDSKSKSSIFNYRPVIEDSLETLLNAAKHKTSENLIDKENYDNHNYLHNNSNKNNSNNKYRASADVETIASYSKEKYKLSRNKTNKIDLPLVNTVSRFPDTVNLSKLGLAKTRANSKSSTSSYYNRVDSSSSIDSLNKNSSGSSKNLFKSKNLSLYYDSGIGVDSPLGNNFYSKYLRMNKLKRLNSNTNEKEYLNLNKSSHEMNNQIDRIKDNSNKCNKSDYNLRKESSSSSSSSGTKQITHLKNYCKTLNPSIGRRYYNETLNSSSSASISAEKAKQSKLIDELKSSKQQYSTSDINSSNKCAARITMRSSSPNNFKNFFHSSLSMQAKDSIGDEILNDESAPKHYHTFNRKSTLTMNGKTFSDNFNKADFTPQLHSGSAIVKSNSIKQKSMNRASKIQAKNDVTIKVNKNFPMYKGNSFVDVNYSESLVDHEMLKSSPNIKPNISSQNLTSEFEKQCIETISKNLNSLTNELNGRKLKIEVEVKRGNSNLKRQQNSENLNFIENTNNESKNVTFFKNQLTLPKIKPKKLISTKIALEKKLTSLNDYSTLYSKNINSKRSEKSLLLNDENDNWQSLSKFPSSLNEKSKAPDKSHIDKEWFHGNLTRNQAYIVIMENQNGNGSFLVRNNSSEEGNFTLCIYKNGKIYNYKINSEDSQLFITTKHKFTNLNDLIEFYKKNSAGLICELKSPIIEQKLVEKCSTVSIAQSSNLKKYKIERRDIEFFEKIGSGQFGVVLKAEYKKRKTVAVKKMKPGSKDDEINFNREAEFMMKLQNLQDTQHRNLVQFFGISKDFDESILIVTEFVKYGSLYNYLLKYKERIVNSKSRLARLLNVCIDVCDGMEYLESNRIIHRDLACRNCLVGEGEVIKVADFGLARFTDDYYIAHPQSQFPVKWSAPEVIKYRSYSSKSDVWSFSCLMYEVFTCGKMPYGGNTTNSIAAKQIISGIIPEKPIYCPLSLYNNVLIKAWSKEPKERPSFKELMQLLNNFNN